MDKPPCSTCPYYSAGGNGTGQCRRSAPHSYSLPGWAVTKDSDWCGQHPEFIAVYYPKWLRERIATELPPYITMPPIPGVPADTFAQANAPDEAGAKAGDVIED